MHATTPLTDDGELAGALHAVVLRLSRLTVGAPVDKAGLAVLYELHQPGAARPSDLAARMHLDLSTISRHLHWLEQQGMIGRTADPDDARAQRISLTARGEDVLGRLLDDRAAVIRDAVAHWEPADRLALRQLLRRLAHDLSRVTGPCPRAAGPASLDPTEQS